MRCNRASAGFTLVEAIIAIVITGIVAGMVAVFIKSPIEAYFDTARRAELTDVADIAVRRIARDIRLALPNSVRHPVDGSDQCIEFMPTKIGGRYRAAQTSTGTGDILDFTTEDAGFDMLWPNSALPVADQIAAGDIVVIYNDGYAGNAYDFTDAGSDLAIVSSVCEPPNAACATTPAGSTEITLTAAKQFPAESPSFRFQVIPSAEHVVAYRCNDGTLSRLSRTLAAARAQPATCADVAAGAVAATLATNVTTCSLNYEPPGAGTGTGRLGIVSIALEITQGGESVRLYHQVHVDNTP